MSENQLGLNDFAGTLTPKVKDSGKDSVRSTFRLSAARSEQLSKLAKLWNDREKDVIDSLVQDLCVDELPEDFKRIIAPMWQGESERKEGLGERKSRVVTKRTLEALERTAEENKVSRDWVLEVVVTT